MKLKIFPILLALLFLLGSPFSAAATSDPVFVIRGHGWGHGIGMCQYGARGMAQAGKDYKTILSTYFQGTQVQSYPENRLDIRVHLETSRSFTLTATSDFTLKNLASGGQLGPYSAGEQIYLTSLETKTGDVLISVKVNGTSVGSYTGPIELIPASSSAEVKWGDKGYYGKFRVITSGFNLLLVNVVDLEKYVYGIEEMPSSWPSEALKAQAVAARTYAYYKIKHPPNPNYDIYDSASDQVYGGTEKIKTSYGSSWKAACDATAKKIVYYGSSVAQVYYHSTCGGHTENVEDVWPSSPLQYLKGVECNYCSASPYYDWEAEFTLDELRTKLGKPNLAYVLVESRIKDRRVDQVKLVMTDGSTELMSGKTFREKLGYNALRSTWFYIAGSTPRIFGKSRYETAVELSKKTFPDPSVVDAVVLASGENFPDALSAAPLAGAVSGPLLLTHGSKLFDSVKNELVRLNPSCVYVIGGPAAVSTEVVQQVEAVLPGASIIRLYGQSRFQTNLKVMEELNKYTSPTSIFLVNGMNFPDAISVSGIAYANKIPIVLTDGQSIDTSLVAFLHKLELSKIIVVGGEKAVSPALKELMQQEFPDAAVVRWGGKSRYETAVIAQQHAVSDFGFDMSRLKLCTGENFPDALAASPYLGASKQLLVFVGSDWLPVSVKDYIQTLKNQCELQLEIIGGEAAVSYEVEFQLYGF